MLHRLPRTHRLTLGSIAIATLISLPALTTAPALADDAATPAPVTSGLDATGYSGPIGAPGALITQVPLASSVSVPAAGRAYRVLYSTRDVHGRPAVSSGEVLLPKRPAPAGGYPVIAWAHGTTGLGDNCAPSVLAHSDRDATYLGHWLDQGYAVVATDYVGLGTPGFMNYLSGTAEAQSVVDSVRAAQQMNLPLAKKWAIVGQSQGAGAALNAARRATALSAGSGLDYRGVVATGTPANIEQIVALGAPTPLALPTALNIYTAYILAGFADARPDLNVPGILTPRGRQIIAKARTLCYAEMQPVVQGVTLGEILATPVSSIPNVRAALTEYMGTPFSGYDRPIFLGQGLLDTDVPAPSALSLYAQMVAAGQPVDFHVYPTQDHSGTVLASIPDSTPFVARIMK
ncbi:alpha/beta hydrolase [Gordonia oryzae]|uniref:Alpha/beta hydrolase n=1 Tax=Gordonia oryzae TaxID=2487349 RepID=A0A3N4GFU6_9ACTN|nr:lipase family protein [Gordonia oryzae]RPA59526.1 alpha/beta hydrolase [Gordonia oryzae]